MASTCREFLIAEAYATWLNDPARNFPSIGSSWTAARVLVPRTDLEGLGAALLVEVVPLAMQGRRRVNRANHQLDYLIGLGIRQHYDTAGAIDSDWTDLRCALVEDIARKTLEASLTVSGGHQVIVAPDEDAVAGGGYDLDVLDHERVFESELAVVFREFRARP